MAVTVTYTPQPDLMGGRGHERTNPREKRAVLKATSPGSENYDTGVAAPTPAQAGLIRNINRIVVDPNADINGLVWMWDEDANVLRAFEAPGGGGEQGLLELDAGDQPTLDMLLTVYGW